MSRPKLKSSFLFFISFAISLLTLTFIQHGQAEWTEMTQTLEEVAKTKIPATEKAIKAGKEIYFKKCSFCHGLEGDGKGEIADYLDPRPRDFTSGIFKFRSTNSGELPTDEDLFRTITRGVPGTAMPAWKDFLTPEERWQVIHYLKAFAEDFKDPDMDPYKQILKIASRNPNSEGDITTKGREIYQKAKCWECHGQKGRGDGPASGTHKDDWGFPILPANLTNGFSYKNGTTGEDIYKTFTTGLNGTPMPSYKDTFEEKDLWALAAYVKSLIRERDTEVIIRSEQVAGELSLDPLDSIWEGVKPVVVRLTGQVITRPRLQNPSIDFITVRSIHNEEEIAFLLEWDDRFRNTKHQVPSEKRFSDTYPVLYDSQLPQVELRDAVAIQFAVKIPEGPRKPYFLYGNAANPVNLWMWKADWQEIAAKKTPVEELNAKGYDNPLVAQPAEGQDVSGKGIWGDGRWKVILIRSITSRGSSQDITFEKGKFIPISFQAWDGANKEYGLRMSLSSWYYLLLETSTPFSVYIYTLMGIMAGVGLEFWFLSRLKKPASPEPQSA